MGCPKQTGGDLSGTLVFDDARLWALWPVSTPAPLVEEPSQGAAVMAYLLG